MTLGLRSAALAGAVVGILSGCGSQSGARAARDAFANARAGKPGAFAGCATITDADMRGFCEYTAIEGTKPASPAACAPVTPGRWHDECVFQIADVTSLTGEVVTVVRECADAGAFRLDCARHVSVQAYRREGRLSPAFEAALGEVAPELDVNGAWRIETRHQVYVDAARHRPAFAVADCADAEAPDDCIAATAEVLHNRWARLARTQPPVHQWLCDAAARGALPEVDDDVERLQLAWVPDPRLDAQLRAAQAEVCRIDSP